MVPPVWCVQHCGPLCHLWALSLVHCLKRILPYQNRSNRETGPVNSALDAKQLECFYWILEGSKMIKCFYLSPISSDVLIAELHIKQLSAGL
jgi:hypothetical protein